MDVREIIRAGDLTAALNQLNQEVKASPADTAKRTILFQVLAYLGKWDKAERHLDLLSSASAGAQAGASQYKKLVAAERERLEVAAGRRRPSLVGKVPPYLDLFFSARESLWAGKGDEGVAALERIEAELPPVAGSADGRPFSGFIDLDATLSRFLEVFVHDQYLWVPFESLIELSTTDPKTLLDLLWNPGRITTNDGIATDCYLPVLYPGTPENGGDDRVRLGRVTEWRGLGGGLYSGAGQHVFLVGDEEKALLELREVVFATASSGR